MRWRFAVVVAAVTSLSASTFAQTVDLGVDLTAAPDPVIAGQQVTLTANVWNDGPDVATGVTLVLDLPGASYVSSSGASFCNQPFPGQSVSCSLNDLWPAAPTMVWVTMNAPAPPGAATATATVSPHFMAIDLGISPNQDSATLTVQPASIMVTDPQMPVTWITGTHVMVQFTHMLPPNQNLTIELTRDGGAS